jgi:hypothetical protein
MFYPVMQEVLQTLQALLSKSSGQAGLKYTSTASHLPVITLICR